MKKKYQSSIVGAVILACFTVATFASADMFVQAFFSPGVPIDSTNNLQSQQNKMSWLDTGNLVGGAYETNPAAMTLPKVLKIGDLVRFRSPTFPGWLAIGMSSGPDVWGARMFCMGKLTNNLANINPRRVRVRTWTSLTDNVLVSTNWLGIDSATGQSITMSSTLVGRKYGADGVHGGLDDVVLNSGTSDVEFNELLAVGPRIFINITNQSDLASSLDYWDVRRPIELHCEYVVFDINMVTVLGRTEIVLSSHPYLWCDRGPDSRIQYIRMESERFPKIYQILKSEDSNGNWTDAPGGLLQNGGIYENDATVAPTNYLFFRAKEDYIVTPAFTSKGVISKHKAPSGGLENGNEIP